MGHPQMTNTELNALFEKAERLYPYYATTPFGIDADPRVIQASKKYGEFMRLPLLHKKLNRWCFETDAMRDLFIIDFQGKGAQREDVE